MVYILNTIEIHFVYPYLGAHLYEQILLLIYLLHIYLICFNFYSILCNTTFSTYLCTYNTSNNIHMI